MKLWRMDGPGRDGLYIAEAETPTPRAGEVLAKVNSVSLNYRDLLVTAGKMGQGGFPFTPASDFAGTVVACGENASRFAPGDRVMSTYIPDWIDGRRRGSARSFDVRTIGGPRQGVLAEYVALPEDWLTQAPLSLSDAEASTLPIAGVTAWFSLIEEGRLRAGQTVVVQGTGGVALFGAQIAQAHGARVIVTSGDDRKLARAKEELGLDIGINRKTQDWAQAVVDATGGLGADHILEIAGGSNLEKSVEAAAIGGQIYVIGVIEGLTLSAPVFPVMLKQIHIHGIVVGHRRAAEDLVRAVDAIGLKPVIDARYPFDALPDALAHLERGAFGKIVIDL